MKKVGIFGVPRSGTSWLGQIFNSHPDVVLRFQPLFSYGHKDSLTAESSAAEIRTFFREILHTRDAFANMTSDAQRQYPIFEKSASPTHIVFKETRYLHVIENMLSRCDEVRVIGLVRNPLAVIASWASAPREFHPEWDLSREWRCAPSKNLDRPEEYFGFDKWRESAEAFLRFSRQFPQQFTLVRYAELNRAPVSTAGRLFDRCGLNMCEQVEEFVAASRSRHDADPYSVYRAQASDDRWRDVLPDEVVKVIVSEVEESPLEAFLREGSDG